MFPRWGLPRNGFHRASVYRALAHDLTVILGDTNSRLVVDLPEGEVLPKRSRNAGGAAARRLATTSKKLQLFNSWGLEILTYKKLIHKKGPHILGIVTTIGLLKSASINAGFISSTSVLASRIGDSKLFP
eukprot:Skav229951  [mRNA]  locus=scaffold2665:220036:220425:- [translate_table: standard]